MALRCPVCKADNVQGPGCRRCKADLTLLFELEERRDRALTAARVLLAQGDLSGAMAQTSSAHKTRKGADSLGLEAVAHLLARNFPEALRLWKDARE